MWRYLLLLIAAALVASFLYWRVRANDSPDEDPSPVGVSGQAPGADEVAGNQTETARAFTRPAPPAGARAFYDPVVIPSCTLVPAEEQEVSSQVDGVLQEVLVDMGSPVGRGQALGRLEDRQLRPQVELLRIKAASRAAELIAKAQYEEADGKVQYARKANASGLRSVSELEYQTYLAQRERFAQEMKKAREDQEAAQKELERAEEQLALHTLRSGIAGEVVKVYKRPGEAVKQGEPLFRVANRGRLRVEGLCKVQQADLLRPGMRVLVEPELRGEQMTALTGHTGPVTGLAVSPDGRLVASASEDKTVLLWDWPRGTRRAVLPHPAEVYAVAFVPAKKGGTYRLVTGCADGQARLWTISDRIEGPVLLSGRHQGAIRTVAVSPDGQRCATGGEDRRLGLHDLSPNGQCAWLGAGADGEEMAHQGALTALHFTPDNRLVSAGRDNVIKVWKLEKTGARLENRYGGRTGDVAQLGVSPDGRRLLFDQGEELRLLDRNDGASRGALRSRQGRFQGLALFAPGGELLLTGGTNGRLQLWKAPADPDQADLLRQASARGFGPGSLLALGRLAPGGFPTCGVVLAGEKGKSLLPRLWDLDGHEVRYFQAPGTTAVTAGAFSPDRRVVFTGGSDHVIRAWAVPPPRQWRQPLEAVITVVGSQVERGTDLVRVRAELANPADPARRLRAGTYASLRIYPETAPEE